MEFILDNKNNNWELKVKLCWIYVWVVSRNIYIFLCCWEIIRFWIGKKILMYFRVVILEEEL